MVKWSSEWRLPLNPLKCESSFFSLDLYQSCLKPSLFLLNTPFNFNLNPTFLGVPFDRTLFFKHQVLSLRKRFIADSVPSDLAPVVPQRNCYVLDIKPLFALLSPMLPQNAFLSHLSPTSSLWKGCIDPPVEKSQAVYRLLLSPSFTRSASSSPSPTNLSLSLKQPSDYLYPFL